MRVPSTRSFCSSVQTTHLSLGRRGFIRAACMHLHQATRLFQLSRTPSTYCLLDQTAHDLSCAWHTRRSDQRQSRTAGSKRAVTTPTDQLTSTHYTAHLPAEGSASSGAVSQDGSDAGNRPSFSSRKTTD